MIPIVVSTISLQLSGSLYLYPYFSWYIPPIHKQFFVGAINFVSYLVARGWENFKFLGDLLYWGDLISFLGERTIFFHRAINAQSCKLKNSWWQNYLLHVCMLTFLTFTWEVFVWEFSVCSSVHSNSQKSVYYCLLITLWKTVWYELWVSEYYLVVTPWKCNCCVIWTLKKFLL